MDGHEAKIEAALKAMTIEEKVALLAGDSMWLSTAIERLKIPAFKMSDGPNGARGSGGLVGGSVTSACLPAGVSLAATWNVELVRSVGELLAEEAKSKGANVLLAPTVNIHRTPLGGRSFECFSEDPYLTSRMAVSYITGVQSRGVGATVKHFVCNDSEFERNTISSEVDERTLREIYLPPFRAAVQEAKSWALMSSYNRVNGIYAGDSGGLLTEILKKEWGFDGIVISDWFGTKSTAEAVRAGLDLEMPGPTVWRGAKLLEAVQAGKVPVEAIDDSARRILRIIERTGANGERLRERALDRPEHRAIARRAAAEGIVLLRNEGALLPLAADGLKSIAIIGPNAKTAQIMGGGSAQVNAHYAVSPYEGIRAKLGDKVKIGYEIGCTNHKMLPHLDQESIRSGDDPGEHGFALSYYGSLDLSGSVIHRAHARLSEQVWMPDSAQDGDLPEAFSAVLEGSFTPAESGRHAFGLTSAGTSRLLIDGKEVIDNWTRQTPGDSYFGTGSAEATAEVELTAGKSYRISVQYSTKGATMMRGVRLGHLPPVAPDAIARAASLASRSDVALVFVGLNGDWETEGRDRLDMDLVGQQAELVERVAAANPRTVIVLQTGSPVTMPWLDKVSAVLEAWFPGQECGNAIADVLFGAVNPAGRLPVTFPVRVEDNPSYTSYPGENGRVRYGEGVFVGYRYYEKKAVAPLFSFGFGLSYTDFTYGKLRLSAQSVSPDDKLSVSIDITNSGRREGQEVVQLYLHDAKASVMRPLKELKAFSKVMLRPGESATVIATLDREAFAYWDDARHAWVAEEGEYTILVGSSSADIRAKAHVTLAKSAVFGYAGGAPSRRLSVESTVRELVADPSTRAILERHLPAIGGDARLGMAMGFSLTQLAGMAPDQVPAEALAAIAADLERIGT